jgi:uncharacterized RDD family membrane protein YckC
MGGSLPFRAWFYTAPMRNFSARETEWLEELDGIELASFWQRAVAFAVDWFIVAIVLSALVTAATAGFFAYMQKHGKSMDDIARMFPAATLENHPQITGHGHLNVKTVHVDEHSRTGEVIKDVTDVVVPILYFGILLWKGKGRTPGKRLMRIRVVSIVHRHLSFWHSVERALGYGAAALEGGFGFVQFFIHPYRRCAQDRLAETMVVTERGYQAMQQKQEHPLLPDIRANSDAADDVPSLAESES